jgi:hypothetical protein
MSPPNAPLLQLTPFSSQVCLLAPVILLLMTLQLAAVNGYPRYNDLIPNGNTVPNPCVNVSGSASETAGNQLWIGVGHLASRGGGGRNQFGVDFANSGRVSFRETSVNLISFCVVVIRTCVVTFKLISINKRLYNKFHASLHTSEALAAMKRAANRQPAFMKHVIPYHVTLMKHVIPYHVTLMKHVIPYHVTLMKHVIPYHVTLMKHECDMVSLVCHEVYIFWLTYSARYCCKGHSSFPFERLNSVFRRNQTSQD